MAAAEEEVGGAAGVLHHRCKVCGKGFQCGRSLGGHMRSHILLGEAVAVAAADQVDSDDEGKRVSPNGAGRSGTNGAVGYGLRENPKKTRRLSDFADEEEKEDGGGGGRGGDGGGGENVVCRGRGKLFSSWKSLFGHMKSHVRDHDEDDDVDLSEDPFFAEEAEMVAPMRPSVPAAMDVMAAPPRRRRRSMRVAAPAPPPPPVLSEFEKEQEDVAICLLMLSRDTTMRSSSEREEPLEKEERKKTTAKQVHLPRNNYDYDDDSALSKYGDAKIKNGDDIKSKNRRASHYYAPNSTSPKQQREVAPPARRARYKCPGCGRVFSSYQALGGHRASHKRINTSCGAAKATPAPAPEPSTETYTSFTTVSPTASPVSVATGITAAKKPAAAAAEKFECHVCFRVFASGQALGGHKRSHVMADAAACSDDTELYSSGNAELEVEQEHSVTAAGSLDLNFSPVP